MANPFARVKPSSWAFGELLTSAQMNSLDTNVSNASASSNCDQEQNRSGVQIPLCMGRGESTDQSIWQISSNFLIQANNVATRWIIDLSGLLPHGVTLTQVQALANGKILGGAAHGAMPATKPNILFSEQDPSGTTNYTVNQTDPSAIVGDYEIDHTITLTVSRTVNRLMKYFVIVKGESGSNSIANYFGEKSMSISWTAP